FRSLATNGIAKPVLNAFRMLAKLSGSAVRAESDHAINLDEIIRRGVRGEPDVSALATLGDSRLCALVWHYHDEDLPGPEADVSLTIGGLPLETGEAKLTHFRIDADHSNAFSAWKRMGSPEKPTAEEQAALERAGELAALGDPEKLRIAEARASVSFRLPRQGVSLLVVEWEAPKR